MSSKKVSSDRRRSRPVTKTSAKTKLKRNKPAMFLAIFIVLMLIFSGVYVIFTSLNSGSNGDNGTATYDSEYPVAEISTSKGLIAIELYIDEAPKTCENFIKLAEDGFYDGLMFHRISDDFIIQAGKTFPDGSTKTSPYGNIETFEGNLLHEDGSISMASTDAMVPGTAEFFICDGAQPGLDGGYAAFGKTIEGIEVVQDIADDNHDSSFEPRPGGGKPIEDIIIEKILIVNQ